MLTNITPDHLDRYDGFADYAAAKERLFTLQHADQTAVIATGDDPSRMIASRVAHRLVRVSAHDIADQTLWPSLQGPHNAQNVACAKAVARALGVDDEAIEAGDGDAAYQSLRDHISKAYITRLKLDAKAVEAGE